MPVAVFAFRHVLTRRTPMGRKEMNEVRFHGGPAFRIKQDDLDRRGVVRNQARMTGVADGRPQLDDGTVLDVTNVVWCTGFRQVFDWIDLPILDEHGWPAEYRGVVDAAPGLYFCGLSFQYAFSSMVFPGVSRDADYVARQIAARSATARPGRRVTEGARGTPVGQRRCAMGVVDELIRAREAYDRREWLAAYDGLSDAAPDELTADDFVRLATAAYLLGRRNDCVQALQRAYQLNLDAGDMLAAVRSAFWLALVLLTSGETAIGGGWVARSQRLLDRGRRRCRGARLRAHPPDVPAHLRR